MLYNLSMNIFLISSKHFYHKIHDIATRLKADGHILTMPNCYDDPTTEERMKSEGEQDHAKWKASMIRHSEDTIREQDAVLVLNFNKGEQQNYIGGATFLEMYDAFRLGKKIFLYNEIPDGMLRDEIAGFQPIVIYGDLSRIG